MADSSYESMMYQAQEKYHIFLRDIATALGLPANAGPEVVLAAVRQQHCSLLHTRCGACGAAITESGTCACPDNRTHPVAIIEKDLVTQLRAKLDRAAAAMKVLIGYILDLECKGFVVEKIIQDANDVLAELPEPPRESEKMKPQEVTLPRCDNCGDNAIVRGTCLRCGYSGRVGNTATEPPLLDKVQPVRYEIDAAGIKPRCIKCGKPGPHYVPPSLGEPGFFLCNSEEKS